MHKALPLALVLVIGGCAPSLQNLQKENTDLKQRLSQAEQQNADLQGRLDQCTELSSVLSREKHAREQNISSLRAKTRAFLKEEFDLLNGFSKNEELMDYLGGELVERGKKDGAGLTIVNRDPLPSDAVIYMVKGLFEPGTTLVPKLFRATDKGVFCVWQGKPLQATAAGLNRLEFEIPLNAMEGDLLGIYFPKAVTVPYDEKTGRFAVYSGEIKIGGTLPSTPKSSGRNYSMGMSGLLN